MSRKLTEKFETTPDLSKRLPQDVYEWMAASTTNRKGTSQDLVGRNQPLDLRAIATVSMAQASMKAKAQAAQPSL